MGIFRKPSFAKASHFAKASRDKSEGQEPSSVPLSGTTEGQGKYNSSGNGSKEEKDVKVKKIKDLNAQNKRKRKEPIRAWKRSDRVVILFLMAATFGLSLYLTARSNGFILKNPLNFKFPNIDLSVKRTVEIGGKRNVDVISKEVIKEFSDATSVLQGKYGLFVIILEDETTYEFGVNEKEIFQAASLIKLPVMAGMYMGNESGDIKLSTKYILKAGDKVEGAGSLYFKPAGYEISYRDLIRLMGKDSDNTAFNICRRILGDEEIDNIAKNIGMVDTNLETNETTPSDVGRFFQKLYLEEFLNKDNTSELLLFLTNTNYENWLTKGLPNNIRISHKYGRETGVVNDAGIVFSAPPYVVVIMSKDVNLDEADGIFAQLSENVYDAINGK